MSFYARDFDAPNGGVDRRTKDVLRWPDRRRHEFWSPWNLAATIDGPPVYANATRCERCGVTYAQHGVVEVAGLPANAKTYNGGSPRTEIPE